MQTICRHLIFVIKLPKHCKAVQLLTAQFMSRKIFECEQGGEDQGEACWFHRHRIQTNYPYLMQCDYKVLFIISKNSTSHFLPMHCSLSHSTLRQLTPAIFLFRPSLLANMTIQVCLTMACSILTVT
jgi:hypothetical protein